MHAMAATAIDLAASMGLNSFEYGRICELMGREPNQTELGMFAVMWSEHCGYKYSKPVLAYFKQYKEAMDGDGLENAGIVPIGDGLGVTFKVESHNHPSAVEPYQGAATGVGGILRDIFTMGARPIACLNSLRFGPLKPGPDTPESIAARNRFLFEHVVAGIAGYGNCVGVPTVAGEVGFHPRFSGNPLVNAMAVGMVKLDEITTSAAEGVGNPVIYMGSATGKDGIHGATFASDSLSEDSDSKRPNVQIGDPFAEKLLIEATLEALQTGAIHSIQDMGAAGLTCSTVEMSAKKGVGMEVDLDLVPMRESDMTAYELMLSESQERMLCVAHSGREQEVLDVFHKWGLKAVVIGHVTDSGRVRVYRHGKLEADLDPTHLADHCPVYQSMVEEPAYYAEAQQFDVSKFTVRDPNAELLTILSDPNIASKRWIFNQFDQEVQTQTLIHPGKADAAVLLPRGTKKGLAIKLDGNALWTYFDPYRGGILAVAEAARNVACTGAMPTGITDGLNFGNPQQPHVYWQFDRAVKGIAEAADALSIPVVSGNVSFYNESELGEVLPTPIIGMLGVLEDGSKAIGSGWSEGDEVVVITPGPLSGTGLGASRYLSAVHGIENGVPESPDMAAEARLHAFLVEGAAQGLLTCAHDLSEGGAATALAEMAITSGHGARLELSRSKVFSEVSPTSALFGEFPGVVFAGVSSQNVEHLKRVANAKGVFVEIIGSVGGTQFQLSADLATKIDLNTAQLLEYYQDSIGSAVNGG